jgi:anti-sigma B factor antagonist
MLGEVQVQPAVTTVILHGDLDLMTVDALREMLHGAAVDASARLIIDLTDVAFLDVMSLSVILGAADTLREDGRQLVVRGASSAVRRICALLNADDVLEPAMPQPRSTARSTSGCTAMSPSSCSGATWPTSCSATRTRCAPWRGWTTRRS